MKKVLLSLSAVTIMSCTNVTIKRVSISNGIEYEKSNYRIEQGFYNGSFTTWVWYNNNIIESWSIEPNKIDKLSIKRDSIKANNLIVKLNKVLR